METNEKVKVEEEDRREEEAIALRTFVVNVKKTKDVGGENKDTHTLSPSLSLSLSLARAHCKASFFSTSLFFF